MRRAEVRIQVARRRRGPEHRPAPGAPEP
jgi:hypothetical protein